MQRIQLPRTSYASIAIMGVLSSLVAPFASAIQGAAPSGFVDLLNQDQGPGEVLRPAGFNLTQPGAMWQNQPGAAMQFEQTYTDFGSYTLDFTLGDGIRGLWSIGRVSIEPNRRYKVSALIRSNFDRAGHEINLGLKPFDPQTNFVVNGSREAGVPAITGGPDGWERWEWSFVTPSSAEIPDAALTLWIYANTGSPAVEFQIADLVAVEMPAEPSLPFAPGEGVTFRGGPGNLPMSIDRVTELPDSIVVEVTATRLDFDVTAGTILATQQIGRKRPVAELDLGSGLAGLRVTASSETEVVLVSDELTFGVQCDGVVVVTPHTESALTVAVIESFATADDSVCQRASFRERRYRRVHRQPASPDGERTPPSDACFKS